MTTPPTMAKLGSRLNGIEKAEGLSRSGSTRGQVRKDISSKMMPQKVP